MPHRSWRPHKVLTNCRAVRDDRRFVHRGFGRQVRCKSDPSRILQQRCPQGKIFCTVASLKGRPQLRNILREHLLPTDLIDAGPTVGAIFDAVTFGNKLRLIRHHRDGAPRRTFAAVVIAIDPNGTGGSFRIEPQRTVQAFRATGATAQGRKSGLTPWRSSALQ